MMIRSGEKNLDEPKTLKVTLPTGLHLRLHSIKILTGRNISETVEQALNDYFDAPEHAPVDALESESQVV